MAKILAVDDDPKILKLLKNALELKGHEVDTVDSATKIRVEELIHYQLILLDIMMPNLDGISFCHQIRERVQCPILFLTAKTEEAAVARGLLSGGDDYIKKPFGVMELNARVEAHLRREVRKKQTKKVVIDSVVLDLERHEITVAGSQVFLTKSQFKICEFLAINQGIVFSKEQIYEAIYPLESDTLISTITEHIRVIRRKFNELECQPIETVWGVGYKWK